MPAGLQIVGEHGVLQIDENYRNLSLRLRGTDASMSSLLIPAISYTNPLIAIRTADVGGGLIYQYSASGADLSFNVYGNAVTYWVFDVPINTSNTVGFQVFNSSGQLVFDTKNEYLKVVGVYTLNYPSTAFTGITQPAGKNYAIIHIDTGKWTQAAAGAAPADLGGFAAYFNTGGQLVTNYGPGTLYQGGAAAKVNVRAPTVMVIDVTNMDISPLVVTISPTSQSLSAASSSQTFAVETATGSGSYIQSYSWDYVGSSGGTWGFSGVTNTYQCTPTVTNAPAGATITATLRCTLVFDAGTVSSSITLTYQNTTAATVTVTPSPTSQFLSAAASFGTFNAQTITVVGGTPSAYSWVLNTQANGSFTLTNATTANVTINVTGIPNVTTATANLTCTVTVAGTNYSSVNIPLSYQNTTPNPSVTLSPGAQSPTGTITSTTFTNETATVSNGTATAYSWTIVSPLRGTFAIANPTAATCTPSVTGVSNGTTANCTLQCITTIGGSSYTNTTSLSYQNTSAAPISLAVAPTSQTSNGTINSFSFSNTTATATGGTPTAYSWTISSPLNGTFTLTNATTATVSASVAGVANATTATATLTCTATIGGTNYTASETLSYQNTSAAGSTITFSPVSGTYNVGDMFTITASAAVIWNYTKTGTTSKNTSTPVTGGSSTIWDGTQADSNTGATTSCVVTLSAVSGGTTIGNWTLNFASVGSGGTCVTASTFLPNIGKAKLIKVGDYLDIADPVTFKIRQGLVSVADKKEAECVRITTLNGIELECSTTAPIVIEGGELVLAPDLVGKSVPVQDNGKWYHDIVVSVINIGIQSIMHITCEDDVFLAGKQNGRYLLHHNLKSL